MLLSLDAYYIEPIKKQDAWSICNFVVSNEERLKRYFPLTLQQNLTPELSNIFIEKKVKAFNTKEEYVFTLKPKNSNKIIGLVYIKELNKKPNQGELAYCIGYDYEGQGITSKAINLLSIYAFDNLNIDILQIIVYKDNLGSIKVAKKCGFTWIKTLEKEHTPPNEEPLDMELYELYKKDN